MAAVVMFGSFEHHMFKQMGEPSPADLLIFGTHVVPDIYGYYRYVVVLVEYHVQSIGQRVFLKGDGYHLKKSLDDSGRLFNPSYGDPTLL